MGDEAHQRTGKLQRPYDLLVFIAERFPDGRVKWDGPLEEYRAQHPNGYTRKGSMQTVFYSHKRHLPYIVRGLALRRGEPMP